MHSSPDGSQATRTRRFFLGPGLPVFLVAAVGVYEAFLCALVFAPEGKGWWGGFAREFKVWCFSYDPRTGGMEWSSVGMMLLEPLFIVAVAILLWRSALGTLRSLANWLAHWRAALAGVVAASAAAGTLLAYAGPGGEAALPPFPGERIRTQITPPSFRLVDQTGQSCSLDELRGRVVLITGVYAMCSTACPQILIETRKLLESLPADLRGRLSVVALALNPEESTETMAALAQGYGFHHPEFRYLNGDPAVMHRLLEDFQFGRVRNPRTMLIDHANLFILVDAEGRIAYRLNLNARHQVWLREATLALTAEAADRQPHRAATP
jgi:protein SCO1